jgi:hypothetical protein
MNVTDRFQQTAVFLAKNGFIAILKKVTGSPVTTIKADGISGQESFHEM